MDNEQLERALAALPLEEPSPELRTRILAATIYRPVPNVATWQIWGLGTFLAVATWALLTLVGPGSASATGLADWASRAISQYAGSASVIWVGIGLSATLWVMFLSAPGRSISLAGR